MLNIAIANLKKMLKDSKAIIGLFIAPVIIMFLFSFLGSPDSRSIEVGITDKAHSQKSDYLVQRLKEDPSISVKEFEEEELEKKIRDRKLLTGLVIKEDGSLEIIKSEENAYMVFKNKINSISKEREVLGSNIKVDSSNKVSKVDHFKPNQKVFVIGFIINFMMFSMIFMINELNELKKTNVLKRNCTCPHKNISLLGGLMLSIFAIIFIQFIIVNAAGFILFKELLFQNTINAIMVFIPFILLILGIGLLVARFCKKSDMSPVIVNLIIMPMGLVSGTFFPKYMMPDFLVKFDFLAPQYWVIKGIESTGSIVEILPSIAILGLMALCMLAASSYDFKKYLQN